MLYTTVRGPCNLSKLVCGRRLFLIYSVKLIEASPVQMVGVIRNGHTYESVWTTANGALQDRRMIPCQGENRVQI